MIPQNTANLWMTLCQDLEAKRLTAEAKQHQAAATAFVEAARALFKERLTRLAEALEIGGDIHQSAGSPSSAESHFREAHDLYLAKDNYGSAARVSLKLAMLAEEWNEIEKARKRYEDALRELEHVHDHSLFPTILNNLAGLLKRSGDAKGAEKYYLRAINEAIHLHGENDPEVATLWNNLGVCHTEYRHLDKAEECHMRALAMREKNYGAVHPDVARSMHNLAVVYHARKDVAKASSFYKAAIATLEQFVPSDDPELQTMKENYARLLTRKRSTQIVRAAREG